MKFGMLVNTQDPPDGRNIARLYQEILREAELAEQVGFDSIFVPEHHMLPDGYLPAPQVLLGAIAARTNRIRLGTSILQLPEWHAINVAEAWAVLDNISQGRSILGVGLGLVEDEFRLFGREVKDGPELFEEQIEIIRRAWTQDSFSFSGRFYNFDQVSITPRVLQKPHPPIWVGAMSEPALRRAGRVGSGWISDPLHHFQVLKSWAEIYRKQAKASGNAAEVVIMRAFMLTEDRAEIERIWWPPLRTSHLFYKNLGFFESGRFNTQWEPWVRTVTDEEWSFDRVAPNRMIAGTPDEVIDEIQRYRDQMGCEYMILYLRHPTGPSHEHVMRAIELFGDKVLPRVN
jgi:probable F420-dependent oxidoreductase